MRLALANAHPAELGLLAQALGLPYTKDAKAVKALREVCRPKKKGGEWDEDPVKLELVHKRCVTDVRPRARSGCIPVCAISTNLNATDKSSTPRSIPGASVSIAFLSPPAATSRPRSATASIPGCTGSPTALFPPSIRCKNCARRSMPAAMSWKTLGKRAVATVLASDPDEVTKQLLELRRDGARSSVRKFAKILDFADANDDRLRGTLTMYGASTGRWTAPGPMLHNLKRNELGVPLSVLDAVIRNDRPYIAQFGSPLTVLSNISRGMLVAPDRTSSVLRRLSHDREPCLGMGCRRGVETAAPSHLRRDW